MKLIVGLGNPGRQYLGTRHNIGFEALDRFAVKAGWIASPQEFDRVARTNFDGLMLDGLIEQDEAGPEKVILLKPMTYMNLSGKSVSAAMAFYQLPAPAMLVVLDDLALPAGRLRIRRSGSSGGHNGLSDIERLLGTTNYPRLRIGIDAPPQFVPGRDYVLGRFTEEQRRAIDPALERAAEALMTWLRRGVTAAMNEFNAEPDAPPRDRGSDSETR